MFRPLAGGRLLIDVPWPLVWGGANRREKAGSKYGSDLGWGSGVNDSELLGHAIREYRREKNLSIDAVARRAHLTKSTLQRAETGAARLGSGDVARLDVTLSAGGALVSLYESLEGIVRPPLYSVRRSTTEAGHRWQALWAGPVWVLIRPKAAASVPMRIDLSWGPWRYWHEWVAGEVLFEDFKVPDDVSVALNARLTHPADIIFGTGTIPIPTAQFVDLRGRWERSD